MHPGSTHGGVLIHSSAGFEDEARNVLAVVRQSFGRLLDSIPGDVRRPAELQRTLSLDSALAWQVHKASTALDPLDVGRHLPGPVALRRVMDAARAQGVADATVEEASQAYQAFLDVVKRHAGDRRTFDSMLAAITESGRSLADLKQRRAAFRANSHLWGLQARVLSATTIVHPGVKEGSIDVVQVTGAVDLRPLRSDVPVRYTGLLRLSHDKPGDQSGLEPIPDAFEEHDPGLVQEFCTRPMPELRSRRLDNGRIEITIACRGVGRAGAVTFFRKVLAQTVHGDTPEKRFESNILVTVPAELQLVDLLVPHDWVVCDSVRSDFFGCRHSPIAYIDQRAEDRLPSAAGARYLGRGLECLRTPDVAAYPNLIGHVLSGMGWRAERFAAFRVAVQFPVLHSSTLLTVPASTAFGS